ncbi:MAG: bifunctional folylpolyglutamate synthase/dihydrofolate synthase, partial [Paracoccaceae bacterium]
LAVTLREQEGRPVHLICGMLNTKDVAGYIAPLASVAEQLLAVSIPGETNTLPAADVVAIADRLGLVAHTADSVETAIDTITAGAPDARILICGSLYLAGHVLRLNGG